MRKTMRKEVTTSTIKLVTIRKGKEGLEIHNLPDYTVLGSLTKQKAQKLVDKKYQEVVTVIEVVVETKTYEMEVEEFIKIASLAGDNNE